MFNFIPLLNQSFLSCQKKLIKGLLLFFIPFNFVTAQNNTIWVKSQYMPQENFMAFVESNSANSYANYMLNKKREQAKNFKLKEQLLKAQEFYLLGEDKKAIKSFKDILNLAYKANWDKEERRIITYSFLRMAQLEEDFEKRKALLISGLDFLGTEENIEDYPDYSLFPPPLITELKEIKKNKNILSLDWNKIFPNHEIILLNGQKVEKDKISSLPHSFYKITALSSSHKEWSKNINLSELARLNIKTTSLTKGPCQKLELLIKAENIKFAPVSNCPKLNPFVLKTKTVNNLALNSDNLILQTETKKFQPPKNWQTWLLVGAGVISIFLVVSLSDNNTDRIDYVY